MKVARLIRVVASIAALVAVAFGMGTYTHANFTDIHVLFGLVVALALLILAVMATFTSGMRRLGGIGVAYAFFMPVFGLTQQMILAGTLHWLVETTHLAVGFGAVALIGNMSMRFTHLKSLKTGKTDGSATSKSLREAQSIG